MTNKFYLDMDGVVADWRANAIRVIGYDCFDPAQRYKEDDWARLRADPHIFRNLPQMARSEELVALARQYRDRLGWELLFLTAIPHNNDVPWTFYDKILWVNERFPDIPVHFGPYSEDKHRHCSPGDILVDDRSDNCAQWAAAGGQAIRVGLTLDTAIQAVQADLAARLVILEQAQQAQLSLRNLVINTL